MTLEQLRTERGKSRAEVAQALGITYHGLRKIELGGETGVSTLESIAKIIGSDFIETWQAWQESKKMLTVSQ